MLTAAAHRRGWQVLACVLCLAGVCCIAPLRVQASDESSMLLLSGRVGLEFGISAPDFFREYRRLTSFTTQSFNAPGIATAALKYRSGRWTIGFEATPTTVHVNDNGTMTINALQNPRQNGKRQLEESITVSSLAMTLSMEYSSRLLQFRDYFVLGVGLGNIHTQWTESCSSFIPNDNRVGGVYVNDYHSSLLFRAGAGIELGFDNNGQESTSSLVIQVHYTYFPNSLNMMKTLAAQENILSAPPDQSYTMGMSSLQLSVGVQFSFARRKT